MKKIIALLLIVTFGFAQMEDSTGVIMTKMTGIKMGKFYSNDGKISALFVFDETREGEVDTVTTLAKKICGDQKSKEKIEQVLIVFNSTVPGITFLIEQDCRDYF